jgi:hypothetical protein
MSAPCSAADLLRLLTTYATGVLSDTGHRAFRVASGAVQPRETRPTYVVQPVCPSVCAESVRWLLFSGSMRVRLTRKLAGKIGGVDLKGFQVDDVLDLPARQARLLVAEQWAVPDSRASDGAYQSAEIIAHAS